MGRLIVFEGIDGSGKSTQSELLRERLRREGIAFQSVTFPRYDKPSAALIRMYLGGEFGTDPADVNAYAASCFYAVDRYASWQQDWRETYENGGLIVMDRYTTSNAIHQGAKLSPEQREEFFRWLAHFEYDLIGIPAPDLVLYMDIPLDTALARIAARSAAAGTGTDIHETSGSYLSLCHACGSQAADLYGWRRIPVTEDGRERTVEEIHEEIWKACMGIVMDRTYKKQFRKGVQADIAALPEDYLKMSNEGIREHFLSLPEYEDAGTIFAYISEGREPDTVGILQAALAAGKTVALPISLDDGVMEPRAIRSLDELTEGRFHIPAPPADAPLVKEEDIDLIIVPAVTFNSRGYRLGRGGGYYDRFLARSDAFSVGLGRDRLIREVPLEDHDQGVACLVTESGVKRFGRNDER